MQGFGAGHSVHLICMQNSTQYIGVPCEQLFLSITNVICCHCRTNFLLLQVNLATISRYIHRKYQYLNQDFIAVAQKVFLKAKKIR
jgi:hypothetical protein